MYYTYIFYTEANLPVVGRLAIKKKKTQNAFNDIIYRLAYKTRIEIVDYRFSGQILRNAYRITRPDWRYGVGFVRPPDGPSV